MALEVKFWTTVNFKELYNDNNFTYKIGKDRMLNTIIFKGNEFACWDNVYDEEDCLSDIKVTEGIGELLQYMWDKYECMFYLDNSFDFQEIYWIRNMIFENNKDKADRVITYKVADIMLNLGIEDKTGKLHKIIENTKGDYDDYIKIEEEHKNRQPIGDIKTYHVINNDFDDGLPF